jgi:PPOX class probable F420-dependent enzyme
VAKLTPSQSRMFTDPYYAVASTVRPDGSPQQSVVWVDYDGENVVFNTAEGRAKPRYIRANPRVSVSVVDPEDPYRWIAVSGPAEMTEEGAAEHINKLSHKYRGRDYNLPPDQQRLIVKVKPERVTAYGLD